MGMDVYGKNPASEVGEYFRNNCWWWRPLWRYCEEVAPEICCKVQYAQSNDGDGLGARDSKKLANILQAEVDAGRTRVYSELRDAELAAVPDDECWCCGGTGKRKEPPATGPGDKHCNCCDGKGSIRPPETEYPFDVDNVKGFIKFLRDCGGFEIC